MLLLIFAKKQPIIASATGQIYSKLIIVNKGDDFMRRIRITKCFPFLLPIRIWQRNVCYQIAMYFDKNKYASEVGEELLPYEICNSKTMMINSNSGQDIIYQKNKVDNLKIVSHTMNQVLIYPGETFSFCKLAYQSKKYGTYKEGLILVDGKLVHAKGGGICHLSNLLYYLFLMSPLTVVERHGHKVKTFPNPDKDSLDGIDATIHSGWLDLKVRNDTSNIYQIVISFDQDYMYGKILTDEEVNKKYSIINSNFKYVKQDAKIFEEVSVVRVIRDKVTNELIYSETLYNEIVEVSYPLSKEIERELDKNGVYIFR